MGSRVGPIKYPGELHAAARSQGIRGLRLPAEQHALGQCVGDSGLGREHGCKAAEWTGSRGSRAPVIAAMLQRTPSRFAITDRERGVCESEELAYTVCVSQQHGLGPSAEDSQITAGVHEARHTVGLM